MATKKALAAAEQKAADDLAEKRIAAKVHSDSAIASCSASEASMRANYADKYDFAASVFALRKQIKEVQSGDMSSMEAMLVGQAQALQQMFAAMIRRASVQDNLKQYQTHMNLGLKVQAQCRATIQALTELKYPRQVVITKQANISQGHQQVNNGVPTPAPGSVTAQNELLEVTHGGQTMDIRAAARTGREDKELETLGKIDRGQDGTRKSHVE